MNRKRQPSQTSRCGITLLEVMLGIAILGILATATITALFYPRHLVVSRARKRAAIHAAIDNIETLSASSYLSIAEGDQLIPNHSADYLINEQTVTTTVYQVETRDDELTFIESAPFEYKYIRTEVEFAGGENPIILETYRSPY